LLPIHARHHICEPDILFLKLNILPFNSLQVSHPILYLLIKFSYAALIELLHLSHFLLHALHHLLLLLVITGASSLSQQHLRGAVIVVVDVSDNPRRRLEAS
jgi:hypothetical protein